MSYTPELPNIEDILKFVTKYNFKGVTKKDLTDKFRIKGQEGRREFKQQIRDMVDGGQITIHGKRYYLPVTEEKAVAKEAKQHTQNEAQSSDMMHLNVIRLTDDGELLCEPVNANLKDDFPLIVLDKKAKAEIGDTINAHVKPTEIEGEFLATEIKKIDKEEPTLLGMVKLRPHSPSVFMPLAKSLAMQDFIIPAIPKGMKIQDGSVVLVDVINKKYGQPIEVAIKELISDDIRGTEVAVGIHNHQLPHVFPADVLREATDLKPISSYGEREDLRHIPIVTIDGEDAKDFDDAVWAENWETDKIKGGFHMIVAIADVAHYVREHSPLDKEGFLRGNSVYFPGHVIPMLPEELSNNLCSLRPKEDRPTLVAHMYIDAQGKLHKYHFTRAVIFSHARLTYDQVQKALDGDIDETIAPLMDSTIRPLFSVYKALVRNRKKRGALDFDMPETTFIMDDSGKVAALEKRDRHDAHRLIEEMMIMANVAAASELQKRGAPCMYRIHPAPSDTKLENLQLALKDFGVKLNMGSSLTPAMIQGAIERIKEEDKANIGMVILRSQEQARYDMDNIGHFGLALERYAHFTSPIRRYSDLIVHRSLITALKLDGYKDIEKPIRLAEKADHLCITERRAQKAEWDVRDRLTARFYSEKLEQPFRAKITTLTKFGMFISVDGGVAEGLLPLRLMGDDHYIFNEKAGKIYGKRTNVSYKLGDEISVTLIEADLVTGRLTFAPEGYKGGNPSQERKHFKKRPSFAGRKEDGAKPSADKPNDGGNKPPKRKHFKRRK